jgi:hypothetical protein
MSGNAFDDLPPTSPEIQALQAASGKRTNAFDDITPPPPSEPSVAESPSLMSQAGRAAGLSTRALVQGAVGLPALAADVGHSVYRLATDPDARSATWEQMKHPSQWFNMPADAPSEQFSHALDPILPQPQTRGERLASIPLAMMGGAMTPNIPVPGASAPANFVNPAQQQAQRLAASLQKSQDAGLVVPPSTTNPSWLNKTVETIGGKEATQNAARSINQTARNNLAAQDLGLQPGMLTPEAVAAVKSEAGQGFESARTIPTVKTDSQYVDDLTNVLQKTHGSNASFPGSANPDAAKVIDTYLQPEFTGDSAVSAIKQLRGKASDAYRTGNSELGMTYKGVSGALESQLERGAQQAGGPYTDLVSALRQSRQTYAKASTIEDALTPQGDVSGQKLAAAWKRGEPLSGGTLTAAEHAVNYPKANLPANSSNISHLNMYGAPALSLMMEHATGSPLGLAAGAALPLVRGGARGYLLGPGQSGALPSQSSRAAALAKALARPNVAAGAYNANSSQ